MDTFDSRILAESSSRNPRLHKTPHGADRGGEGDPGAEWRQRRGGLSWKQRWRKLRRGHCVGRTRTRRWGRHSTDGDERGAAAGSAASGRKGETAKETTAEAHTDAFRCGVQRRA